MGSTPNILALTAIERALAKANCKLSDVYEDMEKVLELVNEIAGEE